MTIENISILTQRKSKPQAFARKKTVHKAVEAFEKIYHAFDAKMSKLETVTKEFMEEGPLA